MSAAWDIELPSMVASQREPRNATSPRKELWDTEIYAQQQIRSLVRQVYSLNSSPSVKQVVFTAIRAESGLVDVCTRVGQVLAERDAGDIAIVGQRPELPAWHSDLPEPETQANRLKWIATRVQRKIWILPPATNGGKTSIQPYLEAIRKEFEYSILVGPPIGESDDAMAMAQFADGIVLVLSAERTKRVMAREVKGVIDQAGVRLLGAVLTDREFPIPEKLYRALSSV